MKIAVLNGSPSGDSSVTLFTLRYIQLFYPGHDIDILHVGQQIRKMEREPECWKSMLAEADLILFCYPVYTFLAPAQLHKFIALMKRSGLDFSQKYASQITTSKHFYDTTAHRYIRDNCADLGLRFVNGLSADMDDLLTEEGREEAVLWFRRLLWSMEHGYYEHSEMPAMDFSPVIADSAEPAELAGNGTVAIVADYGADDTKQSLDAMISRFRSRLPYKTEVVDLQAFPFAGGCIGCFRCAADGKCVYKDGFDDYLREHIQTADAIVYAFPIRDHSMGCLMKTYDDRQFCNGHRTVTMGKPVAYLISGPLAREENVRTLIESRAQVGGNHLAGVATDEREPNAEIDQLAASLTFDLQNGYREPKNFYGVGGLKIFRDLIYQMRGLMRADHKFYKSNGFYDFPQKRKGRIFGMYAVGALMNNENLRRKAGGKINEGMCMPYQKVLDRAQEKLNSERSK